MTINVLDVGRHIELTGFGEMIDFGLTEVGQVETWLGSINGPLRARMLGALVNDQAADNLVEACAKSIAHLDDWSVMLRELLLNAEFCLPVVDVARRVLCVTQPDHPLAAEFETANCAMLICDALSDGERLSFSLTSPLSSGRPWLFFDPEDITNRFSVKLIDFSDQTVTVPMTHLPWLDCRQVVCAAFAVIA